jgi:hypothetical protein
LGQVQSHVRPPPLQHQLAQRIQGADMVWLPIEHLAAGRLGLRQAARLVVLKSNLKPSIDFLLGHRHRPAGSVDDILIKLQTLVYYAMMVGDVRQPKLK